MFVSDCDHGGYHWNGNEDGVVIKATIIVIPNRNHHNHVRGPG